MLIAGKYLWACNRGDNSCNVIDTDANRVVNVIDLEASGKLGDATPDLIDLSPRRSLPNVVRFPSPQTTRNLIRKKWGHNMGAPILIIIK